MGIGEYIREKRRGLNLSLRALSGRIRVSPAHLSRVERGLVPASDDLLSAIAGALGLAGDELLLIAGRLPRSWQETVAASPERAAQRLRSAIAESVGEVAVTYGHALLARSGTRAIEDDSFPFAQLSNIAERESWRKELHRPVYHIHKWWAQRLGSVFRAILLGAFAPRGSDLMAMFYQPARLPGVTVFDPFMGSGTTLGEALKLGARAIGRDINPVSEFLVRNALRVHDRDEVLRTFRAIEADVAAEIRRYYQARLGRSTVDVLYYFWVKRVPCPACGEDVDLFSTYVFARHANRRAHPEARAVCPQCGALHVTRHDAARAKCGACSSVFHPSEGPARGARATCPACREGFAIVRAVQQTGRPPEHRLYAKMILRGDGSKEYLPADDYDHQLYETAVHELRRLRNPYPVVPIAPGYNTDQALKYGYTHWHQMFNDRQLLCLGLLAQRIREITSTGLRELMGCLFSGMLEFNNMFASFKGEGTGAVRHMFSHHILKPERTPLEANPWGTPRSSGAFSTLFERRILRALDYCQNPFEIALVQTGKRQSSEKVYGLSCPIGHDVADTFAEFRDGRSLYLSCGDSSQTDLSDDCVDAIVTDPPFFDNVHYSQLADFFYVWQRHILEPSGRRGPQKATTRSPAEVQQTEPAAFVERLSAVWKECHRVLRRDGLLVFTYHHSRAEGWHCVLQALAEARFVIVATHPIKAEMSVAQPKRQAKEPIDLDVIVVCRKREAAHGPDAAIETTLPTALEDAASQIERFSRAGRRLSRSDVRVVVMAQWIRQLSAHPSVAEMIEHLRARGPDAEEAIAQLHRNQCTPRVLPRLGERQLSLW
jgi:adenine-specific DNA methylase